MEILNNIWMALNISNEELINGLALPLMFIESYLSILLFINILDLKVSSKQKILYIFLTTCEGIISLKFLEIPYNTFLNFIFITVLVYKLLNLSWLKSIFAAIIPSIIFSLLGMLICNPYVTIMHITAEDLITIPLHRITYNIIMYLLVLAIILIIKVSNLNINFIEDMNTKNKVIIFSNLILGFFTLAIQSVVTVYYVDILPIFITFCSFFSLFVYFDISIYSLTRVMKLTLTTRKLESAEEYNKTLHILHDNVRGFKHDFDNIVTTIGGYVRTNDMKGLKKYYIQLEDDCQRVNNLYLLNPEIVNNPRYLQSTY